MQTILNFLSGLKENNNKEWFDKHRDEYQACKQKMLFITEVFNNEISRFDPEVPRIDPKDCIFRIFRDVRFSNDKTPYKVNMGSFIAKGGRKSIWPGYYFHIEPGASFIGGGVYMPQADVLKAIRTEIGDTGDEFRNIIQHETFQKYFPDLYPDALKTAPKGYSTDHPYIDLLKYKSFAFGVQLDDELVSSGDFVSYSVAAFKELYLANNYLHAAINKWM